jgi:7-cyano-7-deazaguanine synthase
MHNNYNLEKINILWTGGLESSFRVCQLSFLPVEIQPYYISFKKKSERNEIEAINNITSVINKNKLKQCNLLPLKVTSIDDILEMKEVTDSYDIFHVEAKIGFQYDWLARFALQSGLKFEIGIEYDPNGKLRKLFNKYGKINEVAIQLSKGGIIEYCELDNNYSTKDLLNIFGNYRFGLPLFRMTKLEIIDVYKNMGYANVIPFTWFCAHPILNRPCGLCNPCRDVMKANLSYRLPLISRFLYKIFKTNPVGVELDKKLKTFYNKHWRN